MGNGLTGCYVPSDEDWMGLELTLGIPADSLMWLDTVVATLEIN